MFTASIVSASILVLILIIVLMKQRSDQHDDSKATEIELEMDLDKLSKSHYLLEAGKNEWRLNEKYYNDPHALLIYALGLLFNNPIIYFDQEKLSMSYNRIRLKFLLDTYTDKTLADTIRIEYLVNKLFEQRESIETNLQEIYRLPSKEENNLSNNLSDTLNLILKH